MDTIYIAPPLIPDEPGHDETLCGTVTLTLASARRIRAIRVQLRGIASMLSDYTYATKVTLEKELEILLDEQEKLPAGSHTFVLLLHSRRA